MLVHLPFAVMGPGGLRFSYWVQLRRGLESESLGGGVLLVLDRLGLHSVTLHDNAAGSRDVAGTLANALAVVSSLVRRRPRRSTWPGCICTAGAIACSPAPRP